MASNFDVDYRSRSASSERNATDGISVLLVDTDEATLEAITAYAERRSESVAVWGTTDPAVALDVVRSREWECLVVGDGPSCPDRQGLVSAVECPTLLLAATDRRADDDLTVAADAVVERGTDDRALAALFEEIRDRTRTRETDELADQRAELARISRADALVQHVVRELGQAATREELELAVCERFVDVEGVTMAWIGKREGANDRIVPGTVVGEPKQYLRDVVATTSVDDAAGGPVIEAVQSGEVQVVDDFRDDGLVSQWRDLALSYDLSSLAMVPITHGGTVHGVLAVYGEEPDTFTDVLADRFALLGDAVGFAMTAVQNKRLLERDETVELEFRSDSEDASLVPLARAFDCRFETVGSVDLGEDVLQYVEVDGAPVADVADAAVERDDVVDVRVVTSEGSNAGIVELRLATSLQTALSDVGARLQRAVTTCSGSRVVVEASHDGDVRTIHEVVCRSNPGADLVSKTDCERSGADDADGVVIDDVLTDRQREILQAAHLTGYYSWPRDTTAEELAESLDIASPTLHQHLRRAEHNILSALFGDRQ